LKNDGVMRTYRLFISALYIASLLFFFLAPPACCAEGDTEPIAVLPLTIGDEQTLMKEAKFYLQARDFRTAINRLETVVFMKNQITEDVRSLLIESIAGQFEIEKKQKNYKEAISQNLKILSLLPAFDFVWINRLLNIYLLSGNYVRTHELCNEILGKQDLLALPPENISQIYGKLAVVYASLRDARKCFENLQKCLSSDQKLRFGFEYFKMIFPKFMPFRDLSDHAASLASQQKSREAYMFAYVHSKIADDTAASEKLTAELLKANPEFKDMMVLKTGETQLASAEVPDNSAKASPEPSAEAAYDTSMVVLSNVPAKLKEGDANGLRPREKKEFDIVFERANELFSVGKYEDALAEYEKAQKIVPQNRKEELERKIFSAYWHSKEDFIKICVYSIILLVLGAFIYYFNPFGRTSSEQYGLINVSKTLKSGLALMEEKKYQRAVAELEKLSEMKLSNTETVALFLNLGIAHYYLNSFASSLMALRKVLQHDYENVDAYKFLGRIYTKTRDRSHKAMEVFNFLIDRRMADIEMLKIVASYNAYQNVMDDRAIQVATDILANEPLNEVAGRTIIKYFNKVKRSDDEALRFVEKFVEAFPRDIETHIVMLETLYRRKEYKRIITECNVLFAYAVDNILVHSIFIDSIVNLNMPKMLLTEYDRLLHENPGSVVTSFISQSIKSIIVDRKKIPQVDYAVAVRVNFNVCHKCFHLNLNEFNNCQRCGSALQV